VVRFESYTMQRLLMAAVRKASLAHSSAVSCRRILNDRRIAVLHMLLLLLLLSSSSSSSSSWSSAPESAATERSSGGAAMLSASHAVVPPDLEHHEPIRCRGGVRGRRRVRAHRRLGRRRGAARPWLIRGCGWAAARRWLDGDGDAIRGSRGRCARGRSSRGRERGVCRCSNRWNS